MTPQESIDLWPKNLLICENCARNLIETKHTIDKLTGKIECPPFEPDWNN